MCLHKRNSSLECNFFLLKIVPLKANSVNMHRCVVCIIFASKETFGGKEQIFIGSARFRFAVCEVVITAIVWFTNAPCSF